MRGHRNRNVSQEPNAVPDNQPDHDPDLGPWDDQLATLTAVVTALRLDDKVTVAAIVDELMQDPEDFAPHEIAIKACLILASICDDFEVRTEHFAEYAAAALQRTVRK